MMGDSRINNGSEGISSSRSRFLNMRASPWRRAQRGNEKSLADTVRVLVKPATQGHKNMVERSILPSQALKPICNEVGASSYRRPATGIPKVATTVFHESEISIFKQLCLDKHDENAAIEILLDSTDYSAPELYTCFSESADLDSRVLSRKKASSIEGKRNFLERFFFKSQRKSPSDQSNSSTSYFLDSSKENHLSLSHSSNASDDQNIPTPPSSIPRTRISVETKSTFPVESNVSWSIATAKTRAESIVDKTKSILDDLQEGGDTVSNISSLSGTKTSSIITPVKLDRHESLGFESIKDIRKCLQEMERQLGQATNKGQRVSRKKVMRALFTVADSLEDDEETDFSKKASSAAMQTKKEDETRGFNIQTPKYDISDNADKSELTTSDDGDFTLDSGAFDEDIDEGIPKNDDSPFNIVSSVGSFFGVNDKDQQAVEEVLDDLLWTEFVSSRQQSKHSKKLNRAHSRPKKNNMSKKGHKRSLQIKEYHGSRAGDNTRQEREHLGTFWWGNRPSNEKDEYSTSSSENEFPSYLPKSITVKQRRKKPANLENSFTRSLSNPHYKVKLVDTESRLGYEMDHISRR